MLSLSQEAGEVVTRHQFQRNCQAIEILYLHLKLIFIMRTFLINFIYTSAGISNSDFVLITQGTFPTSREIYKHIKLTVVEKGLQVHGPLLWTGITELSENDNSQFNLPEED